MVRGPGKFYFSFGSQIRKITAPELCKTEPCRWLIDLEGLRDVDICNAYADAQSTSYPGEKKKGSQISQVWWRVNGNECELKNCESDESLMFGDCADKYADLDFSPTTWRMKQMSDSACHCYLQLPATKSQSFTFVNWCKANRQTAFLDVCTSCNKLITSWFGILASQPQ